jgi:hypothetical protein
MYFKKIHDEGHRPLDAPVGALFFHKGFQAQYRRHLAIL